MYFCITHNQCQFPDRAEIVNIKPPRAGYFTIQSADRAVELRECFQALLCAFKDVGLDLSEAKVMTLKKYINQREFPSVF